jgi:hypothetical protein
MKKFFFCGGSALSVAAMYQWVPGLLRFGVPLLYVGIGFLLIRLKFADTFLKGLALTLLINLCVAVWLTVFSQLLHPPQEHGYIVVTLLMAILAYTVMPMSNVILSYLAAAAGLWVGKRSHG